LFFAIAIGILVVPLFGILAVVCLVGFALAGALKNVTIPWKQIALTLLLLIGTYGMLRLYIPRRIAFWCSRSSFEKLVEELQAKNEGEQLGETQAGLYRVDEAARDERGGVYFRVYRCRDGIGPDVLSYGFCKEPNSAGSPFGAASYRVYRLGRGWYWFRASDDWF
jgi:hypothetical protein